MSTCDRCGGRVHRPGCPFHYAEGYPEDRVRHTMRNGHVELRVCLVGVERVLLRKDTGGQIRPEDMAVTNAEVDALRAARPDLGRHYAKIFPTVTKKATRRVRTPEEKAAAKARIAEMLR